MTGQDQHVHTRVYGPAVTEGIFVTVPRTSSLSTSEVIRRVRERHDL